MLWTILAWILLGLVVGAAARLLKPGRDPMGIGATIVLGIVGALVGGVISWIFTGVAEPFTLVGFILSVVGAILVLFIYYAASSRRRIYP